MKKKKTSDEKLYTCSECGNSYIEIDIDFEVSYKDNYYCEACTDFLMKAGRDAVDPDHHFSSYEDWDENGR